MKESTYLTMVAQQLDERGFGVRLWTEPSMDGFGAWPLLPHVAGAKGHMHVRSAFEDINGERRAILALTRSDVDTVTHPNILVQLTEALPHPENVPEAVMRSMVSDVLDDFVRAKGVLEEMAPGR